MQPVVILLIAGSAMFIMIGGLSLLSHYYTLNGIKSRTVGKLSESASALNDKFSFFYHNYFV